MQKSNDANASGELNFNIDEAQKMHDDTAKAEEAKYVEDLQKWNDANASGELNFNIDEAQKMHDDTAKDE